MATFGSYGCEKSLPPPSSESANCKKIDKIEKELESHGCDLSVTAINGKRKNKTCGKWTKKLQSIYLSCTNGPFGWCATCKVEGAL